MHASHRDSATISECRTLRKQGSRSALVLIEKNKDRQKQLFKQLQKSDTQGEKKSDRPPKKKMKPRDQIPKKQKTDGESKASVPSKSSAKLCQNCAK